MVEPLSLGAGKMEPTPIQFEDPDVIEKPAEINVRHEEEEEGQGQEVEMETEKQ